MVKNKARSLRTCRQLCGWRNIDLQKTASLKESLPRIYQVRFPREAPCWRPRQGTRHGWFLFRLALWRQAVDGEVVRRHVISEACSASDSPLTMARRVIGKAKPWREVIYVRLWRAEEEPQGWVVGYGVDRLVIFSPWHTGVFEIGRASCRERV